MGRDCPIFTQLASQGRVRSERKTTPQPALEGEEHGIPLLVGPGELAMLTQNDPSLENARKAATLGTPPQYTGPHFKWKGPLLYRQDQGQSQLIVSSGLRQRLLYLAHEIPLAGHQAAEKTLARLMQRFY